MLTPWQEHVQQAAASNRGVVYMATPGTPPPTVRELQQATYGRRAQKGPWRAVGYVANDGMTVDEIDALSAEEWHRANPPIKSSFTVRFAGKKSHRRAVAKLFSGRHRLPGDPPLIHKGKKAK